MAQIEVNTNKIRESGSDVVKLSNEYLELINGLFKRMYQVPTLTEEWVGESSTKYASLVMEDKEQYINYGKSLKKCGQELVNYAENIDSAANNTNGIK